MVLDVMVLAVQIGKIIKVVAITGLTVLNSLFNSQYFVKEILSSIILKSKTAINLLVQSIKLYQILEIIIIMRIEVKTILIRLNCN